MDKKKVGMEIDLKKLLLSVARRLWLILLVGIIVAVLAFGYAASFIDDVYAAEVRLYVNNTYGAGTIGFSSSQMTAAQSLATTYMVVLDTYDVLEEVAEVAVNEYGASKTYTVAQLRSMITTAAIDETEVFKVVVSCGNKKDAVKIANAVKDVLPQVVDDVVNGVNEVTAGAPLVALQQAEYKGKVAPNEGRYGLVGAMIGVLVTAIAVVAGDLLDTSINSEEFLAEAYEDIPLLAVIPDAENPKTGSGYKGYYESQKPKAPVRPKAPGQQKGGKQ